MADGQHTDSKFFGCLIFLSGLVVFAVAGVCEVMGVPALTFLYAHPLLLSALVLGFTVMLINRGADHFWGWQHRDPPPPPTQ